MTVSELKEKARQIRLETIEMVAKATSGHPGGSLSATDLLVALYYSKMRLYEDPHDERRDRFVLSKGHANPPLYAILADKGYVDKDELNYLRRLHHPFQGHPESNKCPGIDCSTGSLGQGISVATGMALGFKLRKDDNRVYAMVGDGELDEGLCWEAFMAAANYKLDNLTVIVDRNMLQLDGNTEEIMAHGDLKAKFEAFGFLTDVIDGHDFEEILAALDRHEEGKPHCIIAKTVKGKGVSYMENNVDWHGSVPKGEQLETALRELGGKQ
ncbi:MAG: transketolase [Firmicutes bacterium]|jgi:transketolase|nr:transketolase [Bacillota bacterium]